MNSASLVVAPQWIGDAVMAQPLIEALARRGERVTVAALPWIAPVCRAMPGVSEVVAWPFAHGKLDWAARRAAAAELRGRFDAAYVLPNSIKSALVPWLARIPRRVGYVGEGRPLLLNRRLPNPPKTATHRMPMVAFYGALAGEGAVPPDARPRLAVDTTLRATTLARLGLSSQQYWVFAPGAEYGPAKRWPSAHYATLARQLHAQHRLPVLLLGSAKEADIADEIAALAPGACKALAGQTSLDEAIALIEQARGVASNDSGLMHVAAAFGVPQAAVFGSTSPAHTPPLSPNARVLWLKDGSGGRTDLDCLPCFERECRFGHLRCLQDIAPERVARALEEAVVGAEALNGPATQRP
ncbi:lipopolysaccharide heptosyltransferase II [Rivibacter subsaxonicus]|uniref:lipopolysaccharide heptosyltransferase II n=1 Tax=Rivibacter subsaxonicus TaxID=457575 RepID=A0A4Q7VXA6_9BURK|nr:lipopolysaccharide heptosyltransferase II [Rivibacter subsaxonicus]RZU01148.1 heptosyltransferase-2 [Rivibacter subsaxonicus]